MNILDLIIITFSPFNVLMLLAGFWIGMLFGMLPGLSGVTAVAVLMPLSYVLTPLQALIFMSAIYCTAVFSGSISGILFNSPGDTPAVFTTFDGYPLTLKGEPGRALIVDMVSSGIGGVVGVIIAMSFAAYFVNVALSFGPPEYFALGLFGLSLVSVIGTKYPMKGTISVLIGLLLACVGIDTVTGMHRFTFGNVQLMAGLDFIPVIIGLFAVAEVLNQFANFNFRKKLEKRLKDTALDVSFISKDDFKLCWPHWIRGSILGNFIGTLPGAGATIAAFLGYGVAQKFSKQPEEFGKGAIEGVAGPETANNASVGGAMVPLLTLGIPGSATTAVMLSVFLIHGLQPGPFLFMRSPELMYPIFISMILTNILIIVVPFFLVKHLVKILRVPYEYLGTTILFLSIIGAFAIHNRVYDVWIVFIFGIIGHIMTKYDYSPAGLILGLVLGPMVESGFRQSLVLFQGDLMGFIHRPITLTLIMLSLVFLLWPLLTLFRKKFFRRTE
ncbi:MAG TPA: tripartite tricarboxylate transporter permease [Syntrophales bacterium]|nr:tripartite tricarboxylate transporter permease [Syntrophales bacterium]